MTPTEQLIIELNKTKTKRQHVHICSRANAISIHAGQVAILSEQIKYKGNNNELKQQAYDAAIKTAVAAIRFAEKLDVK
jgi:hypothetical protein